MLRIPNQEEELESRIKEFEKINVGCLFRYCVGLVEERYCLAVRKLDDGKRWIVVHIDRTNIKRLLEKREDILSLVSFDDLYRLTVLK